MEGGELFNRIQERKSFNERGKKTIIGIVIVEVIDVTIDVNLVVVVIVCILECSIITSASFPP